MAALIGSALFENAINWYAPYWLRFCRGVAGPKSSEDFERSITHFLRSWEALRHGKDNSRGLSCGNTLNIHQDILKSGNLLDKRGFVDSEFATTVGD